MRLAFDKLSIDIPADGFAGTLPTITECLAVVAGQAGLDPKKLALIAKPAELRPGTWPIADFDEFNRKLLALKTASVVEILWRIDTSGNPKDCRTITSSGNPVLDPMTCTLVMRRARYEPARDVAAAPVDSWVIQKVTFYPRPGRVAPSSRKR